MTKETSHFLWPSRLIVLVSGFAVGFFLWKTYLGDVPHQYLPTFAHGQWLVAADDAPQGYFRHELYIPAPLQQAWVMVSATDSFILYLNGKAVDGKGYASLNVSGVYDISHYLSPGKNVVGLVARRLSYPGPAMAALEGIYRDQVGHEHVFATDATWKFSPVEQTQGHGEIPWYAEGFDTTAWQPARAMESLDTPEMYPLGAPPLVFAMPPQGKWIGQADFASGQAIFSYTFTLPVKVEDAWMRIASAKPYVLAINGMVIEAEETPRDDETMSLLRFQGAQLWSNQDELTTDLYRIAPLLHAGANRISVSSGQHFPALPGLYVDGFVTYHGEVWPFGSDATWTITAPSLITTAVPMHHAIVLAHLPPKYNALPVKKATTPILPLSYRARQLLSLAPVLLLAAALIYLLWMGSARMLHALGRGTPVEAGKADALAHLPTVLILGSLYLLSFDVRFDPALPFQSWVIGLSVAVLLLCKAMVLLEAWYYRERSRQAEPSTRTRF